MNVVKDWDKSHEIAILEAFCIPTENSLLQPKLTLKLALLLIGDRLGGPEVASDIVYAMMSYLKELKILICRIHQRLDFRALPSCEHITILAIFCDK